MEKVAGKDGLSDYLGVFVFSLLLLLSNVLVYGVARFTQTVKQIRGGKEKRCYDFGRELQRLWS